MNSRRVRLLGCQRRPLPTVGAAPLVVVPYITTGKDRWRTWWKTVLVMIILITVVIGAAAYVHLEKMPLDVLWYSLLRRFGFAQ